MAPFWNDYDIRSKGDIYYYVATDVSNPGIMGDVSNFVSYKQNTTFSGTWMLAATWFDVPHYPHYYTTQYPQYFSPGYRDRLDRKVST